MTAGGEFTAGVTETNVIGIDVNLPLESTTPRQCIVIAKTAFSRISEKWTRANGIIRENKPEIKIW
jgi:hypothetical protein